MLTKQYKKFATYSVVAHLYACLTLSLPLAPQFQEIFYKFLDITTTTTTTTTVLSPLSSSFAVLNFFPEPVEEECLSADKRRRGICMNTYECRMQRGTFHGPCALGFGVCCICEFFLDLFSLFSLAPRIFIFTVPAP